MKPTKHAYAKARQNHPENEHENTTTPLPDHEDVNEPNNIPVPLPHLLEHHTPANSTNEPDTPEHCLTTESSDPIGFVKTHRNIPNKTGDSWTPMKTITANPKPVNGTPPAPYHPRHEALTCPNTTLPPPYKHQSNRADTLRTLKPKTETQPTPDLTETNQ